MPAWLRRSKILAAAVVLSCVSLPAAASEICAKLQARLASVPVTADAQDRTQVYSSAISRQNLELRKARSDLRQLGCSGGSITVYGSSGGGECAAITASVSEMERNLQILEKKRSEASFVADDRALRMRILSEMSQNGCDTTASIELGTTDDRDAVATGAGERDADTRRNAPTTFSNAAGAAMPVGAPSGGALRTVCVRTCDGGFFPVSSSASPIDFRRDQRACAAMCPQTETELFYQPLESPDSRDMVSTVTGQPYSALPNAFAYQSRDLSGDSSCGCDLGAYHRKMSVTDPSSPNGSGGGSASGTTRQDVGSVTTIRIHPVAKAPEQAKAAEERPYDPEERKVRIVGPIFLPNDQPALDLRHPAGSD
ncbi:uncharacterized protein DUF2865 [Rhizobium subbaraonis]|uniref:Uncharacterized protein DUF2865 n=1 Tax=Rhizobium subbaraonis TaxID=908946 RepID=A0A285ULR7_9HYPH|nr:DUF2865 domain-containing protein [Rhizobium subbaraonis]SOC42752.1 uncharacterized protein DUF2865 [Rhizobium subbaraonis]